ncbi:PREDICTED: uncharacterized protein LOC18596696 isoform X2 [Theobroma cacao]|uniref:Uncharacterized protein LOC18596696 isoform X2 n=1 Tax=Theobroma cacao TaxID=3641 RepID=A0AB32WIK4_THECC|nr:PREDICTED: uncharacterized protein LOC18596696 isoform X2 [Theobroma cacao]
MAMASLIQAGCGYSPIFSNNSNNCSFRTGSFGPFGCSSPSSSCTCSSSSHNLDFRSGTNNNWKHQGHRAQAMSTATQGNFASSKSISNGKNEPDHLLVLVHGILASPSDWTYVEAELKRRLGRNFLIYASSCNTYTKTLTGVDGAGKRLADEVLQVVKKTESLKKISFLAHSLGGLFARYAVAVLYTENDSSGTQSDKVTDSSEGNLQTSRPSRRGTIAGLEAVSFITLATPHLGVRGRKQLPFLLGVPILEKLAPPIAPFFVGRTGKQLFLTDGKPNRPPLLLRMASDCEDGKFLYVKQAFIVTEEACFCSDFIIIITYFFMQMRKSKEEDLPLVHLGAALPMQMYLMIIWLAGAHPPSGGRKNLLSPHYDLWMVTNMLWMWTTVHQFLLMAPVFLPKLPKQRRQHRMHLTYKTQSNIMNSWKRK